MSHRHNWYVRGCLIILFAAVVLSCGACSAKKEKTKVKPPVPVTVAVAVQKNVPLQIKAIGTVEPYNSVAVKSQVNGQIARVHFRDGSDVQKGDLLISLDRESFEAALGQCEANLAKDQAQAKFAREQADRYGLMLKDGIVTRDQYDQFRANAESAAAAVVADRAAVRNAQIQLGYCSLRAPIAGRTGTLGLQTGNLVKANDVTLVTINQVSPVYAAFSVPEKRLADIKKAMAAGRMIIEASVPGDPAARESGSVSFLDNAVNAASGTIKLKGLFANGSRKLWPGQFVDVEMTLSSRQNAVVIPTQAVQVSQQGQYVYVVTGEGSAEMRPVTVGPEFGSESVIEKGITAGETVVTSGQLRLTPGAKIERPSVRPGAENKK